MNNQWLPLGWGSDSLSKFIESARHNTLAAFQKYPSTYSILKDIDLIYYELIIVNSVDVDKLIPWSMLLRTHAAYIGSVRLALSGQGSESYMVLRGCLENSLYGLYLSGNPTHRKIWVERVKDEECKKKMKNAFRISNLFTKLEEIDKATYETTKILYDLAIEYGGHPNPSTVAMNLTEIREKDRVYLGHNYISDSITNQLCLKVTASIGICALLIFRNVFHERYDELGISAKLDELKRAVDELQTEKEL